MIILHPSSTSSCHGVDGGPLFRLKCVAAFTLENPLIPRTSSSRYPKARVHFTKLIGNQLCLAPGSLLHVGWLAAPGTVNVAQGP
jgi:hypothetical protein